MLMRIDTIMIEKLKRRIIARSKMARTTKLWMIRLVTMVLIWACSIHLMMTLNSNYWESRVAITYAPLPSIVHPRRMLYENTAYLIVSANGGLNQMRAGICDMVTIARYLNVTLIVPELDKSSFWKDQSEFHDIFDVQHFIHSLKDEVVILKELPSNMKKLKDSGKLLTMPPISWSNMTYYYNIVLPQIKKYQVVHLNKSDNRLANNGIPIDVQKFRCRVNYNSLRFNPTLEKLGKKIVHILRSKGPFLALHLRYEMDMLAFSGCTQGFNALQVKELTSMRYAYPWWKEKAINATKKRVSGQCPLTPEETLLTLKALGIDPNIQLYIAAGQIYGGQTSLAPLLDYFPNLVKKETLLQSQELSPFMNHSSQMAALDYIVSLESDIFVPTYAGNMAKLVEGHRRYLGYRRTINLDRRTLIKLIDEYKNGTLRWGEFSHRVKFIHKDRIGNPKRRLQIPGKPKLEDSFYSNPQECLPQ